MPESFDMGMAAVTIPAATLRERLPATVAAAIKRETLIYKEADVTEDSPVPSSYRRFVEHVVALEAAGLNPVIVNSH